MVAQAGHAVSCAEQDRRVPAGRCLIAPLLDAVALDFVQPHRVGPRPVFGAPASDELVELRVVEHPLAGVAGADMGVEPEQEILLHQPEFLVLALLNEVLVDEPLNVG